MKTLQEIRSAVNENRSYQIGLALLLVIAGFFLWAEHKAHIMGALPYLLLLACPFIHLLMHRNHGNGRRH